MVFLFGGRGLKEIFFSSLGCCVGFVVWVLVVLVVFWLGKRELGNFDFFFFLVLFVLLFFFFFLLFSKLRVSFSRLLCCFGDCAYCLMVVGVLFLCGGVS